MTECADPLYSRNFNIRSGITPGTGIFRLIFLLLSIVLINACSGPEMEYLVYVGTYTGNGSEGIYACRFNPLKGELQSIGLAAKTDNPSFITVDSLGRFLYAVNEIDSFRNEPGGAISVFRINKESGKLTLLQQVPSLGAAPAHLSLDKSGRYLMVANYNGGNVALFPVGTDGLLGRNTAFVQDTGSSVNPDRQTGPHAHFIQSTLDNRHVLVVDLGIDKVLVYRFNADSGSLNPVPSGAVPMDPGAGPRHLAFAPSGKAVYVLNELSSTIAVYSFESETGKMQSKQSISALPKNFTGINTAAEIAVDAKGRFLYVSNRGDDSIGIFSINSVDGTLTPVECVSTGGKTPRNFEIDMTGQWLLVANQNSNNLVFFRIDQANGHLIQADKSVEINAPVCIYSTLR